MAELAHHCSDPRLRTAATAVRDTAARLHALAVAAPSEMRVAVLRAMPEPLHPQSSFFPLHPAPPLPKHRRSCRVACRPCARLHHASVHPDPTRLPWMRARFGAPLAGRALVGKPRRRHVGHGCERQRKEGGASDMWARHFRCPVSLTHWRLIWVMVIWTPREPFRKFRDPDVHFGSSGTWMTPAAKFSGRPCILLPQVYVWLKLPMDI